MRDNSVKVSGVAHTTGITVVEFYEVPQKVGQSLCSAFHPLRPYPSLPPGALSRHAFFSRTPKSSY
jgi:hypothetical protein